MGNVKKVFMKVNPYGYLKVLLNLRPKTGSRGKERCRAQGRAGSKKTILGEYQTVINPNSPIQSHF